MQDTPCNVKNLIITTQAIHCRYIAPLSFHDLSRCRTGIRVFMRFLIAAAAFGGSEAFFLPPFMDLIDGGQAPVLTIV